MTDVAAPDQTAGERTLPLVRDLCEALEAEDVVYCHWKSNVFLDRSRTGENDLDLLVRRTDSERFSAIVHRLGFKQAENPARSLPGVSNYYGYDPASERFVHVHAHYQLVLGDDLTKNYRIPLETALLEAAVEDGEFRVPPPELELIVLVIRLTLKHSTWDAFLARRTKVSASAREELALLRARVDEDLLYPTLREHLPFVDEASFAACLESLEPGSTRRQRMRAGRRLVGQFGMCARRSRAADVGLKLWRRGVGIVRRLLRLREPRKRLDTGGAVIAVVGGDGAGKSTAVSELCKWLSKDFAVTRIHLGRPARSWTTHVVWAAAKLRLALGAAVRGRSSRGGTKNAGFRSRAQMALAVATARDRYIAYRTARRIAGDGGLVICDRFPLPELTLMDAPRVARGHGPEPSSRLTRRLAALEQRYYEQLTLPDLLILLRVDPEVAVARKPEEPAEFVRARWQEIWSVDWQETPARVVDASRSPDAVLSEVKALVWSEL